VVLLPGVLLCVPTAHVGLEPRGRHGLVHVALSGGGNRRRGGRVRHPERADCPGAHHPHLGDPDQRLGRRTFVRSRHAAPQGINLALQCHNLAPKAGVLRFVSCGFGGERFDNLFVHLPLLRLELPISVSTSLQYKHGGENGGE
jgi:hypothetical protein